MDTRGPSGRVVLEEAVGRNRGAVLRRLGRHNELMVEPRAEVLKEGRAARATAPERVRRRLSCRQGARGCPVARSRASARTGMQSDPRAVRDSVWGSAWGSAWGSIASERVGNSRSARSTRVKIHSVKTPTRDRCAGSPAHRSRETSVHRGIDRRTKISGSALTCSSIGFS